MKLVVYSIVLNHHQACVADELYKILDNDFCFVELSDANETKGATDDYSKRTYLLQAWKSSECHNYAMQLAKEADVCVFSGVESLPFQKARLKKGLLSFDMSERWLKRGLKNVLSPVIRKMYLSYIFNSWGNKPLYKLCCSAFTAKDQYKLYTFRNKCYKWGYFTAVDKNFKVEASKHASTSESTLIMWCARFLKLKHAELPIQMAACLKGKGYKFTLDFYGNGSELEPSKRLAHVLKVDDIVSFKGAHPNNEILDAMKRHDIFLFTSDSNEGWGAVANESMANGCTLVVSDAIGSAPYLVKDGENGFLFKSCDVDSLTGKVEWLLNHPAEMKQMQKNAYATMHDMWSPSHAAKSLLKLIDDLKKGRGTSIKEGPCSKA